MSAPKPRDYRARRQRQLDARARGEVPECGREACTSPVGRRPFVGSGTGVELLYCPPCARRINEANGREICALESPMSERHLYASDAEDNHEDPWTNGWDPLICDAATGAREYAEETGLDVGDHVYVIEASEVEGTDADPYAGTPLDVHRTWRFVVTVATDEATEIEEVTRE